MKQEELFVVAELIQSNRVAALGTLNAGAPFVSMVAYAPEADFGGFLLHLSGLSPHMKHLTADPHASLLITERDDDRDDPQTLARITLVGDVSMVVRNSEDYAASRERYLARLPASAMLFDFPDFNLFRFVPTEARYVGGFARAYTLALQHLRAAAEGEGEKGKRGEAGR